jgi:hypothetical protein
VVAFETFGVSRAFIPLHQRSSFIATVLRRSVLSPNTRHTVGPIRVCLAAALLVFAVIGHSTPKRAGEVVTEN